MEKLQDDLAKILSHDNYALVEVNLAIAEYLLRLSDAQN